MKYMNIKKLTAIISAGFILLSISGCQKKEESNKTNSLETGNYQYVETRPSDDLNNENQILNETIADRNQNTSNGSAEDEIVTYFENLESEVNYYINEDNFEKVKEKSKNIAIAGIDFVFYGTEIKGVTFEELTIESKEKILSIVAIIDSKIESKLPGYREIIKDKFGQGYDYVSEKLQEGLTYVDGKLEEKYSEDYKNVKDKANEIKKDAKEGASSIYDKVTEEISEGFTKIKEWYENKTCK